MIDIDDFKKVNDQYGHLTGDKVICCVADELTNAFRKTDLIGRFGGDEFVVLMTKIQSQEIAKIKGTEIIKNVLFSCVKQFNINISISVGLAFSEKKDTLSLLFSRADKALYEAKNTGKGRMVVHGETIPPVSDDGQPIVLVCSKDKQVYSTIALAYGEGAGFLKISSEKELKKTFEKYENRIRIVCIDMRESVPEQLDVMYQYILQKSENGKLLILAICKEGDMKH